MNPFRGFRLVSILLGVVLLLGVSGCEEELTPVITRLEATPSCDIITLHTEPVLNPDGTPQLDEEGNPVVREIGRFLEVRFFGRASGGNTAGDPTGANSPLNWRWDFGDGTVVTNNVAPVHRYTQAGRYTVTLRVEDDDGDADERTIEVYVGEAYTDLDVVVVDASLVEVGARFQTESTGVDSLLKWTATLRGTLDTNCPISGLFQQYAWAWDFGNETNILHVDEPTGEYEPDSGSYTVTLEVTEMSTEVARSIEVGVRNPVATGIKATESKVAGEIVPLELSAWLLSGVSELSATIQVDTLITIQSAQLGQALVDAGFTASIDISGTTLSYTASGPAPLQIGDRMTPVLILQLQIADSVELEPPAGRLLRVFVENPTAMREGEAVTVAAAGGAIDIRDDCNVNGIADNLDILRNPGLDLDRNGIIDSCE